MVSIYQFKSRFQSFLRPAVNLLARWGVRPNTITILGSILSLTTGILIWNGCSIFLLPVVLWVRMAMNAVDGMLAREHQMTTSLGALLNEMTDVVSDVALYLPFLKITSMRPEWMVLLIAGSITSEMIGVMIVALGGGRRYDGPMGKSDRAIVFGLIGTLLGLGVQSDSWINWVAPGVFVLLVVTIWNRGWNGLQLLVTSNSELSPRIQNNQEG